MNRAKLKSYAPAARRQFIEAVTDRATQHGLTKEKTEPVVTKGNVAIIAGKPFPLAVAEKRRRLEERIARHGFDQVMEAMAYTWFNRLVAIRYMELHGYLDHGYRVLSHPNGGPTPEIIEHAEHLDLPGLDKGEVVDLKLDGTKESDLYRMLLIHQCNALHTAMPFLFERIADETELLLPENLLHSHSVIRTLVNEIDEADWQEVEIIGWLYQYYVDKEKQRIDDYSKTRPVDDKDIPAKTQLFTPNWIVKYLVQNSLGRKWLLTYPESSLRQRMAFYMEPAEQTPEVQAQLAAITPASLNPEELTLIDPACGSGHILVEGYDLLKDVYLERGYRLRDIPTLILTKNLFGLEIDDRAAQLAAFALMMKARADDRRVFEVGIQPNVLAIQESNGINVNAIVQAFTEKKVRNEDDLNSGEFGFMASTRAPLFAIENRTTTTVDDELVGSLKALFAVFENAKTYGSLLVIPTALAARLPAIADAVRKAIEDKHLGIQHAARLASTFVSLAALISRRFDCCVANPPYLGSKYFTTKLKVFVTKEYKDAKADLCIAFIERATEFVKKHGSISLITMQGWMFLTSYEEFRTKLLNGNTIQCMAHLGPHAFPSITGQVVQVTMFAASPERLAEYRGSYKRLVNGDSNEKRHAFPVSTIYNPSTSEFALIPGSPLAYWVSGPLRKSFQNPKVGQYVEIEGQNKTADNARFVRLFWEVSSNSIGVGHKWLFYSKGGNARKWYGNLLHVVDWSESARRHYRADPSCRIIDESFWNRIGITWTDITSGPTSFRLLPENATFDMAGPSVFPAKAESLHWLLGLLNSPFTAKLLPVLNPTLHVQLADVKAIPAIDGLQLLEVGDVVRELVHEHKVDWDSFETSWDFQGLPICGRGVETVKLSQDAVDTEYFNRFRRTKNLETSSNRLVIGAYGLQDELSPEVPDDQITLYRPNREQDVKRLFSYALGCAMGRYSLDKPGLIYASSSNEGFLASQYKVFPADADGIIPATKIDWFNDAAGRRFEEFVSVAWPKEHLEENLKFVAESIGVPNGEQPRDTIRRYYADDFYSDHLQTYKRRPIYWMFSSGRLGAFQCLVYLHRYNESTLGRMRTEYVIPLQGKIAARIEQLEGDKAKAPSTPARKRLEKEQETLRRQQQELVAFEERLHHHADMRISINLDDGVKANYAKFGELLAESRAVCGAAEEE